MPNNILKFFLLLLLTQLLVACGGTPKKATEYILYPPEPYSPRIQYLTSFSGPDDFIEDESAFGEFILGDDAKKSAGVKKPYGVGIKDGIIYLVDIRSSGFATFDLKQKKFDMVHGAFDSRMVKPINIFIDDDNNKYLADIKRNLVVVLDKNNQFLKTIGGDELLEPSDVLVTDGKVFVTDTKHHAIHVYDENTAELLYSIDNKEEQIEGLLYFPTNIALSPDNHLYVSATMNFNIQEFTLDGKYIRSIGQVGNKFGNFTRPKGIAIDREGNLYVVDTSFQNVQVFNKEAELLMYFGESGPKPHNINIPAKVVIDYDNISYFQKYAKPGFEIEYLILVTSQFGNSKLNVYGFGQMQDADNSSTKIDIVEPDEIKPDAIKP